MKNQESSSSSVIVLLPDDMAVVPDLEMLQAESAIPTQEKPSYTKKESDDETSRTSYTKSDSSLSSIETGDTTNDTNDETFKAKQKKFFTKRKIAQLFGLFCVFCVICILIVLSVGRQVEMNAVKRAPPTNDLYNTPQVCALLQEADINKQTEDSFDTFDSARLAQDDGHAVAHCGACGACSTWHDMGIQAKTGDSLTGDATNCAFKSVFGGRSAVASCMEQRVGFTKPCQDCWLDNIECSKRHCKFTCIMSKYLFFDSNNQKDGSLNDCLECDEKMCGREFLECSGSNRRRMGIESDIQRNTKTEQCALAEISW